MTAPKVAITTIQEVQTFVDAKSKLEDFKNKHPAIFTELDNLVSDYNTTLEQADKAVRAKGVSCGPFDAYQENIKYDASKLYELVGRDEFFQFGGKLETVTQYSVDKTRLKTMIDSGKVPQGLVDEIATKSLVYHTPKPIKLA